MPLYDLLIKHGEIINPALGQHGQGDVAIAQGHIAALGPDLPASLAARAIDATGKLVVPGLIDMHTHLGFELHTVVVNPDDLCPQSGVTTAVDMGSTGAFTFPWYRERVLSSAVTRLYEFINIASLGTIAIHTPYYVERYGRYIDSADTARMIEENRAFIRGIKVFATSAMVGEWSLEALRAARQVADKVGVPIAVHVSVAPPSLEEVLDFLGPGDLITHTYTPYAQGILDEAGRVKPAVREARRRGVLFDLGHGAGSFTFEIARKALAQDFPPDTISTDVYHANLKTTVIDLPTTISKFLNLGMPLDDALARVTVNAAQALRTPELGVLQVGCPADVAILTLQEGRYRFIDSREAQLEGPWKLICALTVAGGRIVYEANQG